uniref:Uncharacterized protein n=1 Tax=Cacopsylla melanoneura TaxID=428564 RepID=A0A8D8LKP0_9HEMI
MDSCEQDLDIAALGLLFLILQSKNKASKKRKQWCKKWLKRRNQCSHISLISELSEEPLDFLNYLRMTEPAYQKLLSLVYPLIEKQDTPENKIQLSMVGYAPTMVVTGDGEIGRASCRERV